jgi:hypothetical protein
LLEKAGDGCCLGDWRWLEREREMREGKEEMWKMRTDRGIGGGVWKRFGSLHLRRYVDYKEDHDQRYWLCCLSSKSGRNWRDWILLRRR